jgi:hypothetical protein
MSKVFTDLNIPKQDTLILISEGGNSAEKGLLFIITWNYLVSTLCQSSCNLFWLKRFLSYFYFFMVISKNLF